MSSSYRMSPVGFANDVVSRLGEIRTKHLLGTPPQHLFHYTSLSSVKSIITSRCLWATCVADMADTQEIRHGTALVDEQASSLVKKHGGFVGEILSGLSKRIQQRMRDTFVTCFCGLGDSPLHWQRYGSYRLRIATDKQRFPTVRPVTYEAEVQYQKVCYEQSRQDAALQSATEAVATSVELNLSGTPSGPWEGWFVDFFTRAADVLLDIVVALKQPKFCEEQEWRLVVRPRRRLLSSALDWEDNKFRARIKHVPRAHVELYVPQQVGPFRPLLRPPIPFIEVTQTPYTWEPKELVLLRDLLAQNGRLDIPVGSF